MDIRPKFLIEDSHCQNINHRLVYLNDTPNSYDNEKYLKSTYSGTVWSSGPEYTTVPSTYILDDSLSSTSSTSLKQKIRLDIDNTTTISGNYRIGWFYEWAYSSSSSEFILRIQLDDVYNLSYTTSRSVPADSEKFSSSCGFCYKTLSSGAHHIDMDWCSSADGKTASIRRARLDIWRVL